MKLFGTFFITLLLISLLGLFVWGWYSSEKVIPEFVFSGLLGLVGTLIGYVWLRDRHRE